MSDKKPVHRKPKVDYKVPLLDHLEDLATRHNLKLGMEHRFHPVRRWRFDYAFPQIKVAVDYDGVMFRSVGHNSLEKIIKDMERSNHAQLCGWDIYKANAKTVQNKEFFAIIEEAVSNAVDEAECDYTPPELPSKSWDEMTGEERLIAILKPCDTPFLDLLSGEPGKQIVWGRRKEDEHE